MSYIRASWPYTRVKGKSDSYLFPTRDNKDSEDYVEDYGYCSNEALIDIIYKQIKHNDELLAEYVTQKLAERLNVILREKELTDEEYLKECK